MKKLLLLIALCANALAQSAEFDRLFRELSNWGRWGTNDELGALNLVTPAKRKAALALVTEGVSVSLARDAEKVKALDNGSPFIQIMDRAGTNNAGYSCADTYTVSYHGMAHTHIDSLCHFFHDGKMYNGFAQTNVIGSGALKLGIGNLKQGLLSRGILVDVPLLKRVDFLEPGAAVTPEDLDAWEIKSGLKVGAGDVLLIRTGRWARRASFGPWSGKYAGINMACAAWLKKRDVAVIGSDSGGEVLPSGVEGVAMPIHKLALVSMGVWILDNCDLEALADAAKKRNRWEFLLNVAPLAVPGGTGSPVNPIATF